MNFGRLHFFFPDSRLALDLSTDKTLKEARFDRHFVRDLVWSRHQLEELAERRFRAAQVKSQLDGLSFVFAGVHARLQISVNLLLVSVEAHKGLSTFKGHVAKSCQRHGVSSLLQDELKAEAIASGNKDFLSDASYDEASKMSFADLFKKVCYSRLAEQLCFASDACHAACSNTCHCTIQLSSEEVNVMCNR